MSWHEYQEARKLFRADPPFYSLLMAAMMRADTPNTARLQAAWPDLWAETQARYNAPGAILPGEPEPADWAKELYA